MLAVSFFTLIFSSLVWIIVSLRFITENLAGISFFDAGIANILLYTLLVLAPIFILWGVFGQVNQYINNKNVNFQLRKLMGQMKKNQDYSDLLARVLIESEGHIKDGFVLNKFDLLIADMNELLSEIIKNCKLASGEQIENLWSRVQNGGKWAFGKVIIEINNSQPNFKKRILEKAAYDNILSGTIMEFCARYISVVKMLEKHDTDKVFLTMVENGVMGKVFSILAPVSDKLQRGRDATQGFEQEDNFASEDFAPEPLRPEPLRVSRNFAPKDEQLQKKSFFAKLKREKPTYEQPQTQTIVEKDPFSLALEKSFGDDIQIAEPPMDDMPAPRIEPAPRMEMPAPRLEPAYEQEEPSFGEARFDEPEFEINSTQKTLDSLRKEWAELDKPAAPVFERKPVAAPTFEEKPAPSFEKTEENLAYPFGGWSDERNYQK